MSNVHFALYVKGYDKEIGDCPFSARALSVCKMKVKDFNNAVEVIPIDTANKPADFLALNPGGKVPFLCDKDQGLNIDDSTDIVQYIDKICPDCDMKVGYKGPAFVATENVFGKFHKYMKCKEQSELVELKKDLVDELLRIDQYLQSDERKGKYLINDQVCDVDCSVFPKLRHIVVGGKEYRGFVIPRECGALLAYYERMNNTGLFSFLTDAGIIFGWSKFF